MSEKKTLHEAVAEAVNTWDGDHIVTKAAAENLIDHISDYLVDYLIGWQPGDKP